MKKKILALAMTLVMVFSLSACGGSAEQGTPPVTEASSEDLREINVVLDWYPNAVHAFIYLAIEKGYYAEEGLKVNIQFPSNTNDALSLTAAGKAEIGIYYPHDVIQARANQNIPVKAFGSVCQGPLNIILSLADKNITTAADLAGKKIGYAGTELSEAMVKSMMEAAGVGDSYDPGQLIDVGFDLMSSMTTDNVDATIGCMLNHEVPQMEEEGFKVNAFSVCEYGVPYYPELVLVANDDTIAGDSDMLSSFMRASAKGFADMKADPEGAVKVLLDYQNAENFPLSETVEMESTKILLPVMETEGHPFLSSDLDSWQATIKWMKDEGILQEECALSDVVTEIPY